MIRRDYFTFGDLCSRDYNILLDGSGTVGAPERDVQTVSVPGRSGDLHLDNGRWKNTSLSYRCVMIRDFERQFAAFRAKLLATRGYCRLMDTIHPEEYRLAAFLAALEPETIPYNRAGAFTLTFDCKPQRFLRAGERAIRLGSPGVLANPTCFEALPLITVYGSGAGRLAVGGVTLAINSISGYLVLDSDTQNAYKGTENKNAAISGQDFPTLPAGDTAVSWSGGITAVEIVPRWWRL